MAAALLGRRHHRGTAVPEPHDVGGQQVAQGGSDGNKAVGVGGSSRVRECSVSDRTVVVMTRSAQTDDTLAASPLPAPNEDGNSLRILSASDAAFATQITCHVHVEAHGPLPRIIAACVSAGERLSIQFDNCLHRTLLPMGVLPPEHKE